MRSCTILGSAIVEVINGYNYLLTNKCKGKLLEWVNNCDQDHFNNFCLEVSEEWSDSYPLVSLDDYESIADIINDAIKEWV